MSVPKGPAVGCLTGTLVAQCPKLGLMVGDGSILLLGRVISWELQAEWWMSMLKGNAIGGVGQEPARLGGCGTRILPPPGDKKCFLFF